MDENHRMMELFRRQEKVVSNAAKRIRTNPEAADCGLWHQTTISCLQTPFQAKTIRIDTHSLKSEQNTPDWSKLQNFEDWESKSDHHSS